MGGMKVAREKRWNYGEMRLWELEPQRIGRYLGSHSRQREKEKEGEPSSDLLNGLYTRRVKKTKDS